MLTAPGLMRPYMTDSGQYAARTDLAKGVAMKATCESVTLYMRTDSPKHHIIMLDPLQTTLMPDDAAMTARAVRYTRPS